MAWILLILGVALGLGGRALSQVGHHTPMPVGARQNSDYFKIASGVVALTALVCLFVAFVMLF